MSSYVIVLSFLCVDVSTNNTKTNHRRKVIQHFISSFMQAESSSLLAALFPVLAKKYLILFTLTGGKHEENFALTYLCKDLLSEIFYCLQNNSCVLY